MWNWCNGICSWIVKMGNSHLLRVKCESKMIESVIVNVIENRVKGIARQNNSFWCFWRVSPRIIIFRIQFLERRFYAKSTSSVYHFWTSYPKIYIFATNACAVLPFIWKPSRGYEPKRALCASLVK